MAMNDTLANSLSYMLNMEQIGVKECVIRPSSKVIKKVLEVMHQKGYIGEVKENITTRGSELHVTLLGRLNRCNVVKPRFSVGLNTYTKFEKRFLPAKDFGFLIITTNEGIMTHDEAKEKRIGGKLLAYCY
ncbi:MAG: 30S ribosomal protein S8 [Candidatus Woesearchaeota archaeon]